VKYLAGAPLGSGNVDTLALFIVVTVRLALMDVIVRHGVDILIT
jgi:hypothetical protein